MKKEILSIVIVFFTIAASIGFLAGGPDPTGTGYVYTISSVTHPSSLHGTNCMFAGFCDGGVPCAVSNPYCGDQ